MHAFGDDPYSETLHAFANTMPRPKAILALSAHTISDDKVVVLRTEQNRIVHDFNGFPKELYQVQYSCPGEPALAETAATLFKEAGFEIQMDENAPLDHGIWIPLLHLYPKGDVPVVRVSLPLNLLPAQILKMGHAVSKLREQGVMILGTGGAVHNLREMKWAMKSGKGATWAREFEEWLVQTLQRKDVEGLIGSEEHSHFLRSHPSQEHFLPILFTVGAALPGDNVNVLFRGIEYDSLSMLCFSLNHDQKQPH